ncbi:MAG: three-Cys-motif partner protein TcmP [Dehalococcoidia bacterium]
MASKGTDYTELTQRLAFVDDGLAARSVGAWTRDKLALIAYYLPAFAKLCSEKANGWYYVDGFADNGANRIDDFGLAKGSALIGLATEPACKTSILVEMNPADARVLARREAALGLEATVLMGDCNLVLPPALRRLPDLRLPAFCVLDPEGLELDWTTVVACRDNRSWSYPYELLIYFSTPGTTRSAAVQDARFIASNEERLNRLFGGPGWKPIATAIRAGNLQPGEGGRQMLALYASQLRDLGYTTVLSRPAVREQGNLVYHMVFASANAAGKSIMTDAFSRAFATQLPLQF